MPETSIYVYRTLFRITYFYIIRRYNKVRDCLVGIATLYKLEVPGIDPGGGEVLLTRTNQPWGANSPLYNGYLNSRGVALTTHPKLAPRLKEIVELILYSTSGISWPVIW